MAVEVAASPVPDIKLTHFERARELCSPHGPTTIPKLDDHIEFEGMYVYTEEGCSLACRGLCTIVRLIIVIIMYVSLILE